MIYAIDFMQKLSKIFGTILIDFCFFPCSKAHSLWLNFFALRGRCVLDRAGGIFVGCLERVFRKRRAKFCRDVPCLLLFGALRLRNTKTLLLFYGID